MELITTLSNAFVIAAVGALLYWHSRGRFGEVKGQFVEVKERFVDVQAQFTEVKGQMESMRMELQAQISELRTEVNRKFELTMIEVMAVRSDLTHVALAVGARTRPQASQG